MSDVELEQAPIRVLIIDDDEDDFWLISDFIQDIPQQKFQVDWCPTYKMGLEALMNPLHDIYFIDYHLGAKTGIDLLKEGLNQGCLKPIILLTGQGNQKIDVEAMRSGAVDYLTKSQLTSEQLDRCIRYAIQRSSTLIESKQNERKFKSMFEKSKDFIFLAGPDLTLRDVNGAATELTGYLPTELLNMNLADLFASQTDHTTMLKKLKENKELIDEKVELFTKDHICRRTIISATFETDSSGEAYVQGIIHDISNLQTAEEIKSQAEKFEARGMIVRTLAHEIRNPLHNIILALGYLKSETPIENLEFINVIDRNSKRINDLIDELMDSNQYYKMKLDITPLQRVVMEAVALAADRLALRNVILKTQYPPSDARVLVDRERLKIAFHNIIVNAIESMIQPLGKLNVSVFARGNFHVVQIVDNGCGMSAENKARLFEPYFTTKPKGMGLGLPTALSILQSHKAEVEVTSVVNEGTSFTITFPAL